MMLPPSAARMAGCPTSWTAWTRRWRSAGAVPDAVTQRVRHQRAYLLRGGVRGEDHPGRSALEAGGHAALRHDYPHWDGDWPHTVSSVRKREDVSEEVTRKMLHDNVVRFYGASALAGGEVRAAVH